MIYIAWFIIYFANLFHTFRKITLAFLMKHDRVVSNVWISKPL